MKKIYLCTWKHSRTSKESRETDWKKEKKKINKLWKNLEWLNVHVFGIPNIGSMKEQKTFWRNNGWSFSKLNENTDPKSTINPMKEKHEENYTKEHHKLTETSEKNVNSQRKTIYLQRIKDKKYRFLIHNKTRQWNKTAKALKRKVNLELYTQWKYLSKGQINNFWDIKQLKNSWLADRHYKKC